VYLISRLGVTGVKETLAADLPETIARLRGATLLPICVGFGISTPDQAAAVGAMADGVVVGSALVQQAESSVDAALALVRSLRQGLDHLSGRASSDAA
jgi:tryptophan synthase alpha chain